jgi:hypothetical protein
MSCPAGYFFNDRTKRCESFSVGPVPEGSEIRYSVAGGRLYLIFLFSLAAGAGWSAWRSKR